MLIAAAWTSPLPCIFDGFSAAPRANSTRDLRFSCGTRGQRIDTAKLCGRKLDEIRPGGLGLHFIRQAMDTVEFTRVGRTNQLRLVKYLQPAKLDPNS